MSSEETPAEESASTNDPVIPDLAGSISDSFEATVSSIIDPLTSADDPDAPSTTDSVEADTHDILEDQSIRIDGTEKQSPPTREQDDIFPLNSDPQEVPDHRSLDHIEPLSDPPLALAPGPLEEDSDLDDTESTIDRIVEAREVPPPETHTDLLEYARRHEVESLLQDDYANARRYKITEDVIQEAIRIERGRTDVESWIAAIDSRINRLRDRIDEIESTWSERIGQLEEGFNARQSDMEARHAAERVDLEEQWSSPATLLSFDKASPALLQLRQLQRNQALSKDFDKALLIKADADKLQQQEQLEAQMRAANTARMQYSRLQIRQAQEAAVAEEHRQQQIMNCIELKEKEIAPLKLAIQQLEAKKGGGKPKVVSPMITRPRSITGNGRTTSPNTRRSLYAYRVSKDQGRLNLPSFNVFESMHPVRAMSQPTRPRTTKRYRALRL
jgi:hypothetical protein